LHAAASSTDGIAFARSEIVCVAIDYRPEIDGFLPIPGVPTNLGLRNRDGIEPVFGISSFIPVYGDDVLPKMPLEALKDGAGKDVEAPIGANSESGR